MGYCHENYEFSIHHYRPALIGTLHVSYLEDVVNVVVLVVVVVMVVV